MIKIVMDESGSQKTTDGEATMVRGNIEIAGNKELCVFQLSVALEQLIRGDYDSLFDKALHIALERIEHDKK